MIETSNFRAYDVDVYITEIYDQAETQTDDVCLLRELIGHAKRLRILEPFCGNGRIFIPLAQDGHEVVGIDKSKPMLDSARHKIMKLPEVVQKKISLQQVDVVTDTWPKGFDLLILGANCFYELATPDEQEACIRSAQDSLKLNGYLFLDNNHMEGDLDPSWCEPGINENRFPTGMCFDGTSVKGSTETIWYNAKERLVQFRRTVEITTPDGKTRKKEWIEQKHPSSTMEMQTWLQKYSFVIENLWGDRKQSPYADQSSRAVFWARR
jgi:SAM-dependent methyltransferase